MSLSHKLGPWQEAQPSCPASPTPRITPRAGPHPDESLVPPATYTARPQAPPQGPQLPWDRSRDKGLWVPFPQRPIGSRGSQSFTSLGQGFTSLQPGGGVWPLPCPLRGRKEAEGAILGPCQYKHQVCKKGREEKGMTEEGMVGWHH